MDQRLSNHASNTEPQNSVNRSHVSDNTEAHNIPMTRHIVGIRSGISPRESVIIA